MSPWVFIHILSLSFPQLFRQKVGDIYRLHFGPKVAVVFNGYDVIKEAFTKRGDDFIDGSFFYFDWADNEIEQVGIVFSSGWEHPLFSPCNVV